MPRPSLMARFELTDVQAEAILNMRLRSLRKLEEIEIRNEHKTLTEEQGQLEALLGSDKQAVGRDHQADRRAQEGLSATGHARSAGAARTEFADAPDADCTTKSPAAFIEREPITVDPLRKGLDPRAEGPHRPRSTRRASRPATG